MTQSIPRRRFLTVSAATLAVAAGVGRADAPVARWRGMALGARASLQIGGLSQGEAAPIVSSLQAEILRLERVFSLYRRDSEISRLNRDGALRAPSPDLLRVLSLCEALNSATEGAFDPTVQSIFRCYADAGGNMRSPSKDELMTAHAAVGWGGVRFDADAVRLLKPGTGLTLNGIAQGYITDRISEMLRQVGLKDVLVDMGEIAALGRRPDGRAWQAGIADPDGAILRTLSLSDRALATSSPQGIFIDARRRVGHIIDPANGSGESTPALVSVSSATAALADGLSTGLCVLSPRRHKAAIARFPGSRIEFVGAA